MCTIILNDADTFTGACKARGPLSSSLVETSECAGRSVLMSRAFTKESDNETPLPLPERPVSSGPNPVTPRGARLIEETLREIERTLKDTEDEGLQRDRRYWLSRRATMQQVSIPSLPDRVSFGTCVTIKRRGSEREVQIVGQDEANPSKNLISWTSPLARALEGAVVGETVELKLGETLEPIAILAIRSCEN